MDLEVKRGIQAQGVMAVGGVTVPGWVTVSACRTKGEGQTCFISALTHTHTQEEVSTHAIKQFESRL